jgi:hypothetical protein
MPAGIGEKLVRLHPDPKAFWFWTQKYEGFKFVDKNHYFQNSKVNNTIYSVENLLHTIIDIHFLSSSDYLVCTMSSNVRNSNKKKEEFSKNH